MNRSTLFGVFVALWLAPHVVAAEVQATLSAREAYVGSPVYLRVQVSDAEEIEPPEIPEIDGVEVREEGAPMRSSRIAIINGRRTESQSVVWRYALTPQREGRFTVPPVVVRAQGETLETESLTFVATRSETGDLLLVTVEGNESSVYVGEPLELTLKVWIKPYRDRQFDVTLVEGDMWRMVSESSRWGVFEPRLREMARQNQRPGGREVLREDNSGEPRSYYLYEIDATIYPKRPGRIDAEDVRIVVDYPTRLERSRDPFEEFFRGSPFGANPLGDRAPWGDRLTIGATRPLEAQATVAPIEVRPIPTAGRPLDYRGAVGRYEIVTQAAPREVKAGDVIGLSIGITGTGPMELVQAPPLGELPELSRDFRVPKEPLAGFVQGDTKFFEVEIRPKRAGVSEIPAIPFTFFDPEAGEFRTVESEPIPIEVEPAETLALEAILAADSDAGAVGDGASTEPSKSWEIRLLEPSFANAHSEELLRTGHGSMLGRWFLASLVVPPLVCAAVLGVRGRRHVRRWLPSFGSARGRARRAVLAADSAQRIIDAVAAYVLEMLPDETLRNSMADTDSMTRSAGALRLMGRYDLAAEMESLELWARRTGSLYENCNPPSPREGREERAGRAMAAARVHFNEVPRVNCPPLANARPSRGEGEVGLVDGSRIGSETGMVDSATWNRDQSGELESLRSEALGLVDRLEAGVRQRDRRSIRGGKRRASSAMGPGRRTAVILMALSLSMLADSVQAAEPVALDPDQRVAVLKEAGELYRRAQELPEESAEALELYALAAEKYQLLVDIGIASSRLSTNLANAYFQAGELGRAIVHYQRALYHDPWNQQAAVNLWHANALVDARVSRGEGASSKGAALDGAVGGIGAREVVRRVRYHNERMVVAVGRGVVAMCAAAASLVFWGLMALRVAGWGLPAWKIGAVPLVVLVLSLASLGMAGSTVAAWGMSGEGAAAGVAVVDALVLRSGDGEAFPVVGTVEEAQGQPLKVIGERGEWTKVDLEGAGVRGWVPEAYVERLAPRLRP